MAPNIPKRLACLNLPIPKFIFRRADEFPVSDMNSAILTLILKSTALYMHLEKFVLNGSILIKVKMQFPT